MAHDMLMVFVAFGITAMSGRRPGNAMTAEAVDLLLQLSFSKPGVSNEIRHRNHQAVQA
jgi:hypothetical protein